MLSPAGFQIPKPKKMAPVSMTQPESGGVPKLDVINCHKYGGFEESRKSLHGPLTVLRDQLEQFMCLHYQTLVNSEEVADCKSWGLMHEANSDLTICFVLQSSFTIWWHVVPWDKFCSGSNLPVVLASNELALNRFCFSICLSIILGKKKILCWSAHWGALGERLIRLWEVFRQFEEGRNSSGKQRLGSLLDWRDKWKALVQYFTLLKFPIFFLWGFRHLRNRLWALIPLAINTTVFGLS